MIRQPICYNCINFFMEDGNSCKAFPKGIPLEILLGKNDHRQPLPEQENQIIFEPTESARKRMKIMPVEFFELFSQLVEANKEVADFSDTTPDSLIKKAEAALGLTFPPSYKWFLKKYGCGDIMGSEFYGVIKDDFENSGIPDAIWLTLKYRARELPHNLILIFAFGTGEYAALDLSRCDADGEAPVITCWPGFPIDLSMAEILAGSFAEFLYKTVKASLDSNAG